MLQRAKSDMAIVFSTGAQEAAEQRSWFFGVTLEGSIEGQLRFAEWS
jgi:hypothetical protein